MLRDLARALTLIPRHRRRQWALLIPLALGAAGLEGLGAGAVFVLAASIADPADAGQLPLVSRAARWLPLSDSPDLIVGLSAAVMVFYVVRGLSLTAVAWIQATVVQRSASEVARRVFRAYLTAPYVFHLRRNSARLIQSVGRSVDSAFDNGLGAAVSVATEALTLLGLTIFIAFAAPVAAFAAVVAVGLVLGVPVWVTRRWSPRYGAEARLLNEALHQDLHESLASFKEVRVLGVERHFESIFSIRRARLAAVRVRQSALATGVRAFVETAFVVSLLLAIIVVTTRGVNSSHLIGLMALYAYAGFRIVPSANRLMLYLNVFHGARPAVNALCNDLEEIETMPTALEQDGGPRLSFSDHITIEAVSYRYEGSHGLALDAVSLSLRRGESLGIVGATGAGKSTLLDVMIGLLEPQSGRVLVDGQDIREKRGAWQHCIGYVPQTFTMLDDTVRRNVAFGRDDAEIDDDRVLAALTLARLDEVVTALPHGLDTVLGERGARLSGGERQRVAIARALYHAPDVLVFDEATSALDAQTEQAIIRAIDELRRVKTVVVVAHRLSTVRACDRLVCLEGGRVTGEGAYDELLAHHPVFRAMATASGL